MAERQVIVVDVETTGLDVERHVVVEVAWQNLGTGEGGRFVPPHDVSSALANASLEALRVNRYVDRLADADQDDGTAAGRLWELLAGNTLAGATPTFDAAFLTAMYRNAYDLDTHDIDGPPPWHHRLVDLSAFAAGVLMLPLGELPGLAEVCRLTGVKHVDPHTALGDVAATVACFEALILPQRFVLGVDPEPDALRSVAAGVDRLIRDLRMGAVPQTFLAGVAVEDVSEESGTKAVEP